MHSIALLGNNPVRTADRSRLPPFHFLSNQQK
jgi:hypothetical protein